jgi:hypothetical protein
MRLLIFALMLLAAAGAPALAQDVGWQPPPEHLTIGYEGEGKVDISHHGIDTGPTIKSFEDMMRNCIDHKFGLSNGGHNIKSDINPQR